MNKPAIFLDRDGTLIEDTHYPREAEKVRWIPEAAEALRELQKLGYLLFVISNQSGVGRGIIQDSQFREVHDRFCELLKQEQIEIKEFSYCFHKPEDQCECRKPNTKLIKELAKAHSVDLNQSFTVGDKWTDVLLGLRVGATGLLLSATHSAPPPADIPPSMQRVFQDWSGIMSFIKKSVR